MRTDNGFWAFGMIISMVMSLVACGASGAGGVAIGEAPVAMGPPEPLLPGSAHFVPGESMRFELSLRGILGGEAALGVGVPGERDGKSVVIVRSRVASAGVVAMFKEVRDEVTTSIDAQTGLPLEHHAEVKFGDKERIINSTFAGGEPGNFKIEVLRIDRRGRAQYRQAMPDKLAAYDSHAAMGAIRGWRAEPGQHAYLYALVGRHLWQNTIRMTGRERVRTRLGAFDAIRIDGVARRMHRNLREDTRKPARYYTIWLSDDAQRMPILVTGKTEYGDVKAELVDYNQPVSLHAGK